MCNQVDITTISECTYEAGIFYPILNKNMCEAKEQCSAVCPYDVFEIRKVFAHEKQELSLFVRLKICAQGNKQAFAVNANLCHVHLTCIKT